MQTVILFESNVKKKKCLQNLSGRSSGRIKHQKTDSSAGCLRDFMSLQKNQVFQIKKKEKKRKYDKKKTCHCGFQLLSV